MTSVKYFGHLYTSVLRHFGKFNSLRYCPSILLKNPKEFALIRSISTSFPVMATADDSSKPKFTNRLAKEKSPYLLQHQHNPVDW